MADAAPTSPTRQPARTRWAVERKVAWASSAAFIVLLCLCLFTARLMLTLMQTSESVAHTYHVLDLLEKTSAALNDATAIVWAYVITGDEALIRRRDAALSQLESAVQDLKQLVADNSEQLERITLLEGLLAERRESLNLALLARQTSGFAAAQTATADSAQPAQSDAIVLALAQMETVEQTQLARREHDNRRSATTLFVWAGLLVVVVVAIVFGGLMRLRREVRQRRRLHEEVEENRRFLDSVIEHIPHMVFVKEAAGLRFVRLNRAGEQLLGIPREELLGHSVGELFSAEQAAESVAEDRSTLAEAGVLDIPAEQLQTRHKGLRTLHTIKIVIPDNLGKPAYLLGISEDITEDIERERQIVELNESLTRRTDELEVSNKELESFSYSISHDLRAPLRAVDSFALMLEEDYGSQLDGEARRFIHVIRSGAQKMAQLIDDLLAFSRVGRFSLQTETIDMTAMAHAATAEILASHIESKPDVLIHTLPVARGDSLVVRQVWINLMSNAVKYSAKRRDASIVVSGERAGTDAIFHVCDNGAGFDMRYYDKLFGVFQRLHSADEFSGTGVGLAIVQRIVSRHGGRVWAEGKPGEGACFHFCLPAGEAA
jgi:PAS domain S-box-containing protein